MKRHTGLKITVAVVTMVLMTLGTEAHTSQTNEVAGSSRNPRFGILKALLPYINLKITNPFECRGQNSVNGIQPLGTCMSWKDCTAAFGRVDGECAAGYGSCCILETACGGTIERNRTYLTNNGSFTSGSFNCQYTIKKLKENSFANNLFGACQVRLDFESFTLAQPDNTTSLCTNDYFEVTDNINAFGRICGTNNKQHIYLPIGNSDTVATINLVGTPLSFTSRNWRISASYIPCISNMTAPPGCLQYFPGDTGSIETFNYLPGGTISTSLTQIGGLKYTACIGDKDGQCGVTLTSTRFSLSGDASVATTVATVGAANCPQDSLGVMVRDKLGVPGTNSFFCGTKLDPITTYFRPFTLAVRTDDTEPVASEKVNAGFSIQYTRLPC